MEDFAAVLARAAKAVQGGAVRGVQEACDDLLSRSRDEVPVDQGDLSASGKVTVQATGTGAEGAVSYDTPYAVRQHEDPSLSHQDGRKGRYLADPLEQGSAGYMQHIEKAIGDSLR